MCTCVLGASRRLRDRGIVIGRGSAAGNVFRLQAPMCIHEEPVNFTFDMLEEVGREFKEENKL